MKRQLNIIVIGFLLGLSAHAAAQFGGGGMGGGMGGGGMGGGPRPNRPPEGTAPCAAPGAMPNLADDISMQMDKVATQLKLTPAQAPLWASYRDQVFAFVSDQMRVPRTSAASQGNAKQQIDRKLDTARNLVTALEDVAKAANRLYDGLDTEQQRLADELLVTTLPSAHSGARPTARSDGAPRPMSR